MRSIFLFLFLTAAASAQDTPLPHYPALFDVHNVAEHDVLKLRKEPNTLSIVIGKFAYDKKGIEMILISPRGEWGMISSGDQPTGWVKMEFLKQTLPDPRELDFERDLTCLGKEPDWLLTTSAEGAVTLSVGGRESNLTRSYASRLRNPGPRSLGFGKQVMVASAEGVELTALLTPTLCWVGDDRFGLVFDLLRAEGDGHMFMSGCCSMTGRQN